WTTFTAFGIAFVLFAFLSPNIEAVDNTKIDVFQAGLLSTDLIHWYTIIPLLVLFALTFVKVPAMMALAASSLTAILVTSFHHTPSVGTVFGVMLDRKSTRLNSSHVSISYAVFCLQKKKINLFMLLFHY